MRRLDKKPDMTNWTEDRKRSFVGLVSDERQTLDEALENIVDEKWRKYFRDTYKKS